MMTIRTCRGPRWAAWVTMSVCAAVLALADAPAGAAWAQDGEDAQPAAESPAAETPANGFDAEVQALSDPMSAEAMLGPTAADPTIPPDQLRLLVMPMRQDRLVDEADAWLGLLQAKVAELSLVELDVRTATGAARQPLLAQANELRIERDRLATRLAVVLDSLEAKGGDVTEYRAYASAVSGIEFDWWDPAAAWQAFVGWLVSPEGGIKWGLAILKFIVIVIIARIISNIVGRIVRQGVKRMKNASALLKDFFVMIARQTVFLIGVVMAIGALGINVGPVLAAIGGIAFIIGFALQGTLSNFASGVMILLYRPYDVGSVVNVAGVSGIVESMTLVSTSIKTFDNQLIIVPNNSIWGDVITNVTGKDTRRVDLTFGVSYSEDMAKAESILSGVLSAHPKVLADPAPTIKVHELADSSVNFICRPWVKTADYWEVYWDVMRTVKERFDAEGVTIPFPQRDVHVHQAG